MHRLTKLAAVGLAVLILASGIGSAVGPAAQTATESTTERPADDRRAASEGLTERDRPAGFAPPSHDAPAHDTHVGWRGVADELGLTDEQLSTVQTTVRKLREDGVSRAEIRQAVLADLESFGYDRADVRQAHHDARLSARMATHLELTHEQADVVVDDVRELRAEGATWPEIETAVTERLESFGLNDAEIHHALWHMETAMQHHQMHRVLELQDRFDLSDEQMNEVTETIREMRSDGASPEEIRDAVRDLLESYGVEFDGDDRPSPDRPTDGAPADDADE